MAQLGQRPSLCKPGNLSSASGTYIKIEERRSNSIHKVVLDLYTRSMAHIK